MAKAKAKPPCHHYLAGRCRYGDSCKFQHSQIISQSATGESILQDTAVPPPTFVAQWDTNNSERIQPPISVAHRGEQAHPDPGPSQRSPPVIGKTRLKRGEAPCYAWKAGSCRKGAKCWFAHDPEVQAAENRRREDADRRAQAAREREAAQALRRAQLEAEEQERIRQDRLMREEAARQAEEQRLEQARLQQEQERERFAAAAREDATRTIQQVVLGSIVTFASGLEIKALITGFDSCTVHVRNLPADARPDEIRTIFTQQGITADRLLVSSVRRMPDGKQEATIVTDAEYGNVLAVGLEAIEFRDERLSFEVGVCNIAGGMGAGTSGDSGANSYKTLTISWRTPSARYVGICDSMDAVRSKIRELNGLIFQGRKIRVGLNTPPPGRIIPNFNPASIVISNLPFDVLETELREFTGLLDLRRLRSGSGCTIPMETSVQVLRSHLQGYNLTAFPSDVPRPTLDGVVSVEAQFSSHDDAKNAYDSLEGTRPFYLNSANLWLRLPAPHVYTLTIPYLQYESQRRIWGELKTSIKDTKACNIIIQEQGSRGIARIRVMGSIKPAVGALKVRVESLAAGEGVDGWSPALATPGSAFVRSVFADTGAFLRGDWTKKQLKLYGDPTSVSAARDMIRKELERLAGLERTVYLPRQSVGFFMRQGLAELQAILGEENVKLNARNHTITISGGEEARHHLDRLITHSRNNARAPTAAATDQLCCPICMDDVTVPIHVGCGHSYCTACLRHYLLSALESDTFPLACMGDEGKCEIPIALPTLQRLLPPDSFNRLLEVAFTAHVAKHPQEFVYCKTPDCTQIYRTANPLVPSALQCPSCFSTVCSGCNEDAHDGTSCEENRLHKDPEAQDRATEEWIRNQGNRIKRCPQCNVHIEKNAGCNHMSCRCGAHICWICMRLFPREDIYGHMGEAHGGIYTEDRAEDAPRPAGDPFHGVDYAEQVEALRQAQIAARAARFAENMHRDNVERQQLENLRERRRERAEALLVQEAAERRRNIEIAHEEAARRRRQEAERQQANNDGGGWCVLM